MTTFRKRKALLILTLFATQNSAAADFGGPIDEIKGHYLLGSCAIEITPLKPGAGEAPRLASIRLEDTLTGAKIFFLWDLTSDLMDRQTLQNRAEGFELRREWGSPKGRTTVTLFAKGSRAGPILNLKATLSGLEGSKTVSCEGIHPSLNLFGAKK